MDVLNVSIIWAACRHHHQAPGHQHGHQQGTQQVKAPGHQQHGRHVNGPIKCRVLVLLSHQQLLEEAPHQEAKMYVP